MNKQEKIGRDRVRDNSPSRVNKTIDQKTREDINFYKEMGQSAIRARLKQLDHEWSIEQALELNASLIAFAGITLGATVNKKWLILPAVVTAFLTQHAIQGWCPPLPLFRMFGVRTQKEIEYERYQLLNELKVPTL